MSDARDDEGLDELEYVGSLPPLPEIQRAVEVAWREAWGEDAALRAQLHPENQSADSPPPAPFSLDRTQGADPLTVTLIVIAAHAGASVSKTVVLDLWRKIVLPKLERRWGEGVVREVAARRKRR